MKGLHCNVSADHLCVDLTVCTSDPAGLKQVSAFILKVVPFTTKVRRLAGMLVDF